jgi:hypothetical protein
MTTTSNPARPAFTTAQEAFIRRAQPRDARGRFVSKRHGWVNYAAFFIDQAVEWSDVMRGQIERSAGAVDDHMVEEGDTPADVQVGRQYALALEDEERVTVLRLYFVRLFAGKGRWYLNLKFANGCFLGITHNQWVALKPSLVDRFAIGQPVQFRDGKTGVVAWHLTDGRIVVKLPKPGYPPSGHWDYFTRDQLSAAVTP